MRPILAAEAGNAILQVIVVLSVLILAIYFVSDRIQNQRKIVLQTGSVLKARFALQSLMDYTYFAIQRRYCLTDTLLAEDSDKCKLKYKVGVDGTRSGRSIERVLLSDEQAKNMVDMINNNSIDLGLEAITPMSADGIRDIDHIDIRTKAKDIISTHPLYPMINPLYQVMKQELKSASKFKALELVLRVQIQRDDDKHVPRTGNEVYFWVKVSLEDGTKKVLTINNTTKLAVSSYGAMSPREVGSFGLMIGRDLRLDGGDDSEPGDVMLPPVDNKNDVQGPGLVFMSPVFVNRNVHLPFVSKANGGHKTGFSNKYSPVTFSDRVVLGRGIVYEGNSIYKPESAGGRDSMLWTDNKLFGGFKMGVLVDGFFDKGLNVFTKVAASAPISDALQQKCNARYKMGTDTELIRASVFYGNLLSTAADGTLKYRLGYTDGNSFKKGAGPFGAVDHSRFGTGTVTRVPDAPDAAAKEAVLNVAVRFGTGASPREVTQVRLSNNSSVTFVTQPASEEYETLLNTKKADAEALPQTTPTEIDARNAAIAAAQAKLDELAGWKANPGKVTLTVRKIEKISLGASREQKNVLDLEIKIEHPEAFRDATTPEPNLVAPRFELLGYDNIFDNDYGAPLSMTEPINYVTKNKQRFLNFKFDGDTIQAPSGFSASATGEPISPEIPNDNVDYAELDEQCNAANNAATGQSFGALEWNIDLAEKSTFKSWNYADDDGKLPAAPLTDPDSTAAHTINFNAGNSKRWPLDGPKNIYAGSLGRDEFKVRSIVPTCKIQRTAELVTGFFTCHTLIIEERTLPLYIIGTFVVRQIVFAEATGLADDTTPIPPHSPSAARAAYKAGIYWMSIYHPEAVLHLRHAAVLRPKLVPSAACIDGASATDLPIWAQAANRISRISDNRSCNVVGLRSKSNPIQWTAIDPDCGLLPDGSATVCKKHPVNFFVMEHARGGGP